MKFTYAVSAKSVRVFCGDQIAGYASQVFVSDGLHLLTVCFDKVYTNYSFRTASVKQTRILLTGTLL